jgi:hypothetical protein
MEFTLSGPDIVRSDHQRWLLNHWAGQRQLATLPIWHGLDVIEVAVPFDDLSYTEVVKENGNMRFRIAFHGSRIAQAYGRSNCIGKFLDEILPPGYSNVALSTYRQTVEGKLPVYTVSDMRDPAGRIVHYERLLLPFTIAGGETERVLASLESHSPEGQFENSGLMVSPARPPAFALCTTIQC